MRGEGITVIRRSFPDEENAESLSIAPLLSRSIANSNSNSSNFGLLLLGKQMRLPSIFFNSTTIYLLISIKFHYWTLLKCFNYFVAKTFLFLCREVFPTYHKFCYRKLLTKVCIELLNNMLWSNFSYLVIWHNLLLNY